MDIDKEFIQYNDNFNKRNNIKNIRTVVGSIFDTKLPNENFDVVIARFLIQHLKDVKVSKNKRNEELALFELKRVLKKGGKIILVDSDHKYLDNVYPNTPHSFKLAYQHYKARKGALKSGNNSGTQLYDLLKKSNYYNINLNSIYVSSNMFKEGIKKFLPMLNPKMYISSLKNKFVSKTVYDNAVVEFEKLKKNKKAKMEILIFMAYAEKLDVNLKQSITSFIDDKENYVPKGEL
jgi:ubiquinone/menaquinone biosynthesis C-methylase UbiE